MKRKGAVLLAAAIGLGVVGCAPVKVVDDDDTCSKAKPLPPIVVRNDDLNTTLGDRSDCSVVKYFKDALAKIEYRIGTAFEKHNLKGLLTVYDGDGQVIDQRPVDPSLFRYNFEFEVKAQKQYFVEFKATEGSYAYSAQVSFTNVDPCAKCTEDEVCDKDEGTCRPREKVCDPPCDEEESLICQEGKCVPACNPECRKGFTCNIETKECERDSGKECSPRCKRGEICNRRNGRCYEKKQAGCAGGCPAGQLCQAGKCVVPGGDGQKCPPCPNPTDVCARETGYKCISNTGDGKVGPIVGLVVSTLRAGQGTVVYVNRGDRHGVKTNQRGKLCGKYGFVVINVYPTRSKVKTNATLEEIGECKSVVIPR